MYVYVPIVPQFEEEKRRKKKMVSCSDIKVASRTLDLTEDICGQIKDVLEDEGFLKKFIDYSITPISEKKAILVVLLCTNSAEDHY